MYYNLSSTLIYNYFFPSFFTVIPEVEDSDNIGKLPVLSSSQQVCMEALDLAMCQLEEENNNDQDESSPLQLPYLTNSQQLWLESLEFSMEDQDSRLSTGKEVLHHT